MAKLGRPSKYNPELANRVEEYLQRCGTNQMKLPQVSEFARFIDINEDTLVEWEKKYPEFSAARKKIMDYQKEQLINDGIYGGKEVNSVMCIFLLKANHGLIETDRHEFKGEGFLIKLDAGNIIQPTSKVSAETA